MGSLTVHVLDGKQNPVAGERVYCNFVRSVLGILPTTSEKHTDGGGVAKFDDVPAGTVQVHVRGKKVEVGVGTNDHEDVTVTV